MDEDHKSKKPIGSDLPSVLLLLSTLLFVLLIIDYDTRSVDFQSSWVIVAAFALTFFYIVLVVGESEPARKREFLKAYAIVLLLIVAFILAYEIYKTNWPSPLGNIVGRMIWKVGSILLIIQSICVVALTAWANHRATGDERRTAKHRLVLSILMLFFSPANYLLYVLLFFEGT
jgi:hypothetical protein